MRITFLNLGSAVSFGATSPSVPKEWAQLSVEALASALAKGGEHQVFVFGEPTAPGIHQGVLRAHRDTFNPLEPGDALVLIGPPHEWLPVVAADRKVYWVTDLPLPEWEPLIAPFVDMVVCSTEFDLRRVKAMWPSIRCAKVVPPACPGPRDSTPSPVQARAGLLVFPAAAPGSRQQALLFRDQSSIPKGVAQVLACADEGSLPDAHSVSGQRIAITAPSGLGPSLPGVAAAWWPNPGSHSQMLQVIECMRAGVVPIGPAGSWFQEVVGDCGLLMPERMDGERAVQECSQLISGLLANRAALETCARKAVARAAIRYAPEVVASLFMQAVFANQPQPWESSAVTVSAAQTREAPLAPVASPQAPEPSVSVVIPLHNHGRYLARALGSVTWQLGPCDEAIVIDDGSTDLGRFDPEAAFRQRVMWLRNPERRGVSFSRNRGIERSQAEWIKFLDADDILAPFALNVVRTRQLLLPPDVVVVAGGCHRIVDGRHRDYLAGAAESLRLILSKNPLLPSATFVRRRALLEVGMFNERIDFEEDWDLWLRLFRRFGPQAFAVVDQPICYYCINTEERRQMQRQATVDGIPVREYFRQQYGVVVSPC